MHFQFTFRLYFFFFSCERIRKRMKSEIFLESESHVGGCDHSTANVRICFHSKIKISFQITNSKMKNTFFIIRDFVIYTILTRDFTYFANNMREVRYNGNGAPFFITRAYRFNVEEKNFDKKNTLAADGIITPK